MIRKPIINNKQKMCHQFAVINAKSASKIFPRYQDAYSNDNMN